MYVTVLRIYASGAPRALSTSLSFSLINSVKSKFTHLGYNNNIRWMDYTSALFILQNSKLLYYIVQVSCLTAWPGNVHRDLPCVFYDRFRMKFFRNNTFLCVAFVLPVSSNRMATFHYKPCRHIVLFTKHLTIKTQDFERKRCRRHFCHLSISYIRHFPYSYK